MDDQLIVESAYSDITTAIIMTAIMVTLQVRFRSCQTDRLLLVVLWVHPISYYAMSISGILALIDEDKNKKLANIFQSAMLPLSTMFIRAGIVIFAFEMILIKLNLILDDPDRY